MSFEINRRKARRRRQLSGRHKIHGTAERPRLSVFRSARHVHLQVIDDDRGATLVWASTMEPEIRDSVSHTGNTEAARKVGELIAKRALEADLKLVVFDRAGFPYHGRVQAAAEAAREGGLEF
jgi:large subunit ribosomal protein L18